MNRTTILLTGASGVMGRALIDELCVDYDLLCLRYRRPLADPRVREVIGDLSQPDLGLAPDELRRLSGLVDLVIHSGAMTKWNAAEEAVASVNVDGARSIAAFAERAKAPLYHMSTAFVARAGEQGGAGGGPAAYIASKVEAERVVRESRTGSVILRPSVIIGDSRDGHIAAFQGIHMMAGAVVKNSVPVIPADPNSHIDFVPQDLVTTAVRNLLEAGVSDGDFWLTAGPNALLLSEVVDNCLAVAERLGQDVHQPRMMPLESMERLLLPLMEDVLPPGLRRRFRSFAQIMLLFQDAEPLPSDMDKLGLAEQATHAALDEAFTRNNLYWAQLNGLPLPAEEAVAVKDPGVPLSVQHRS